MTYGGESIRSYAHSEYGRLGTVSINCEWSEQYV